MPEGHKQRALLDNLIALPAYLAEYIDKYKQVAAHRKTGFSGVEPLLETLDIFDRKLQIDRTPEETEVLLTLDLIERSERTKRDRLDPQQKSNNKRGNRR